VTAPFGAAAQFDIAGKIAQNSFDAERGRVQAAMALSYSAIAIQDKYFCLPIHKN
jgi:hypothetical protein